jgi:hypothetical protein
VTQSVRGFRIRLETLPNTPDSRGAGSMVKESPPLTLAEEANRVEYSIWVSDHLPASAQVMVHQILGQEASRFLQLWRWVPSRRS